MKVAAAYAKVMLQDPELKAYYAAKAGRGQNAWNIAIKDAYHSPEIQNIKLEETTVVVSAKNDFRVEHVQVKVFDAQGNRQQSGRAVMGRNGVDWYDKAASLPHVHPVILFHCSHSSAGLHYFVGNFYPR